MQMFKGEAKEMAQKIRLLDREVERLREQRNIEREKRTKAEYKCMLLEKMVAMKVCLYMDQKNAFESCLRLVFPRLSLFLFQFPLLLMDTHVILVLFLFHFPCCYISRSWI